LELKMNPFEHCLHDLSALNTAQLGSLAYSAF
jgi:hypothetical protein